MDDAKNRARITTKYVYIIALIIALGSLGIFYVIKNFDKGQDRPGRQSSISVLEDRDGNIYNFTMMLDEKVWMTDNLNIDILESYCQHDDSLQCNRYGRLYTWKAAVKGCGVVGDGWRLPTNDEWKTMAKPYGGIINDSDDQGRSAYEKLLIGGSTEFNALLGGNREMNGNYERLEAHGFYWTATEYDRGEAWFYNFAKGSALLNHHTGTKEHAFSARCIQEMEILE